MTIVQVQAMWTPMNNRILTAEDRANANRLKSIWLRKKAELSLTQMSASRQLGIAQPTFSQYLNCIIALNTDMVLKMAQLLQVNPTEIDPNLSNIRSIVTYANSPRLIELPVLGTLSGRSPFQRRIANVHLRDEGHFAVILADTPDYLNAGVPNNSAVVVDLFTNPLAPTRMIAVRLARNDAFQLVDFLEARPNTLRVKRADAPTPESIRLSGIQQLFLVHSIEPG